MINLKQLNLWYMYILALLIHDATLHHFTSKMGVLSLFFSSPKYQALF